MATPQEPKQIVDHLFRHEAGKMVAVLARLFGFTNIEQAEDIVHDTMLTALETWKFGNLPANPQAWLYRAAKNKAIDSLRKKKVHSKAERSLAVLLDSEYALAPAVNELFTEHEISDSQLRMMYACCHPSISFESQVTLILKILCGLTTQEIANAFLTQEDTIQKRLYRTKEKIRSENITMEYPGAEAMPARTDTVMKALYLLFNEGYNSSHPQMLIREDLCEEAMRLTLLLTTNEKTSQPSVYALLALMCYQVSRFQSRTDKQGHIILLKDQDRTTWNRFLIEKGNEYLLIAATGDTTHEFHLEAAIASMHANAASFEETDWKSILMFYNRLYEQTLNPMVQLNRCIVLGETDGYEKAIAELKKLPTLQHNMHYHTALGELYLKNNQKQEAAVAFTNAQKLATTETDAELISRKLKLCQ